MARDLFIPIDPAKAWPFGVRQTGHAINMDRLTAGERLQLEEDARSDPRFISNDGDAATVFATCRRIIAARHLMAVIKARDALRMA